VRTIVIFSACFIGLLCVIARSYLEPFGTVEGQQVLLVAGVFDLAGIVMMIRLVGEPVRPRLLGNDRQGIRA
jgi:hypothetical protein